MAIFKTANGKGKYYDLQSKENVIDYIFNMKKMPHNYRGYYGVDIKNPAESMEIVSAQFGKTDGVQLRHFIISFEPGELMDIMNANIIAHQVCRYLNTQFQAVYAVHENPANPHIHIVMNSVSYVDGHRYYGTKKEHHAMMDTIRRVLREYCIKELRYVTNS